VARLDRGGLGGARRVEARVGELGAERLDARLGLTDAIEQAVELLALLVRERLLPRGFGRERAGGLRGLAGSTAGATAAIGTFDNSARCGLLGELGLALGAQAQVRRPRAGEIGRASCRERVSTPV
jgi:hypothetical protein